MLGGFSYSFFSSLSSFFFLFYYQLKLNCHLPPWKLQWHPDQKKKVLTLRIVIKVFLQDAGLSYRLDSNLGNYFSIKMIDCFFGGETKSRQSKFKNSSVGRVPGADKKCWLWTGSAERMFISDTKYKTRWLKIQRQVDMSRRAKSQSPKCWAISNESHWHPEIHPRKPTEIKKENSSSHSVRKLSKELVMFGRSSTKNRSYYLINKKVLPSRTRELLFSSNCISLHLSIVGNSMIKTFIHYCRNFLKHIHTCLNEVTM